MKLNILLFMIVLLGFEFQGIAGLRRGNFNPSYDGPDSYGGHDSYGGPDDSYYGNGGLDEYSYQLGYQQGLDDGTKRQSTSIGRSGSRYRTYGAMKEIVLPALEILLNNGVSVATSLEEPFLMTLQNVDELKEVLDEARDLSGESTLLRTVKNTFKPLLVTLIDWTGLRHFLVNENRIRKQSFRTGQDYNFGILKGALIRGVAKTADVADEIASWFTDVGKSISPAIAVLDGAEMGDLYNSLELTEDNEVQTSLRLFRRKKPSRPKKPTPKKRPAPNRKPIPNKKPDLNQNKGSAGDILKGYVQGGIQAIDTVGDIANIVDTVQEFAKEGQSEEIEAVGDEEDEVDMENPEETF